MDPTPSISDGLQALQKRGGLPEFGVGAAPVFLLSAGWRSGSTLVQRLLASDGTVLMWGEPYDHCGLIRSLSGSLRAFGEPWPPVRPRGTWPPDPYFVRPDEPPTERTWIANAYPALPDLLAAHRAFFDRLFDRPARQAGFGRWGIKAIRLHGEHADYLQALYPDARFVFLHRNPWDAWISYRRRHDERSAAYWWYWSWPDEPVSTAAHFARIWAASVASFRQWAPVLGAAVVAYEDVVTGDATPVLAEAAGVRISDKVLRKRIGGSAADGSTAWVPDPADLREIEREAGEAARELGYAGPSKAAS